MKKLLFTLGAATLLLLPSCNGEQKKGGEISNLINTEVTDDTLATQTLSFDSEDEQFGVDITIDMPQGESDMAKAISAFIYADIDTMTVEQITGDPDNTYESLLKKAGKGQDMINFFGKYNVEKLKAYRVSAGDDDDRGYGYSYRLKKTKESDKFVTYVRTTYINLGGAHGNPAEFNYIFVKPNGKLLEDILDKNKLEELQPTLRKGIMSYLSMYGSNVKEENLMEYLMLGDDPYIPIPVNTPAIEGDSLYISYQPYEIAPYAMGMPSFSVSIKDVEPYLTEEAKKILF